MFSSTMDCRRHVLPPRFKLTFAFQPFRMFHHSFQDNSNSVSLCFRLLVYKWSPVYPALSGKISLLADSPVETSEQGNAYIKWFGVAFSAICSTNHCYQSVPRISIILQAQNCLVALWEGDLSLPKVHDEPLSYVEGSPLTLRNHFIQPYRVLDTLFSEYY